VLSLILLMNHVHRGSRSHAELKIKRLALHVPFFNFGIEVVELEREAKPWDKKKEERKADTNGESWTAVASHVINVSECHISIENVFFGRLSKYQKQPSLPPPSAQELEDCGPSVAGYLEAAEAVGCSPVPGTVARSIEVI